MKVSFTSLFKIENLIVVDSSLILFFSGIICGLVIAL